MSLGMISFESRSDSVQVPTEISFDRFRRWVHSPEYPERGRFSYLAGEVLIDMSPENLQSHNRAKTDLGGDMRTWISRLDLGELLTDGALLINELVGLSTEPDLMFCSWENLRSGRVSYCESTPGSGNLVEVVGSPDLTVEIVSRSSVRKDRVVLMDLYYQAGIEEYWLIDARGPTIDFQLFVRGTDGFVPVAADADSYLRSQVLGGSFQLERTVSRAGSFQYTLHSKP